jgi:hypothetical protein
VPEVSGEFVKQAVIVSGNVGAILDAGSLQPADTIDRGDAFAAAIDIRSRQFLDTLAPQLPKLARQPPRKVRPARTPASERQLNVK